MPDNTIDSLAIEVSSNVSNASKSIDDLCNKLNHLSSRMSESIKHLKDFSASVSTVNSAVQALKLDRLNLSTINSQLQQFVQSMSALGSLNLRNNGLNSFVNATRRLNETLNSTGDVSGKIQNMISELSGLSSIPDVSNNVNRFVSSIARLANAGGSIGTVVSELPNLGENLRKITAAFAEIGEVSQPINTFVQSIAQLANAGDKTKKTADQLENLSKNLKSFLQTMSTVPKISRNTIQMTQAIAQLANAGGSAGRAAQSTVNAFSRLGQGAAGAVRKVNSLGSAVGNVGINAKRSIPSIMSLIAKFWTLKTAATKITSAVKSSADFLEDWDYFKNAFQQVADSSKTSWKEAGYDSAEEYANSFSERARELTSKMSGYDISSEGLLSENTTGKSLGMSPSLLLNYQATFAQISSSMGATSDQAEKLSKALTMIGADLASIRNEDFKKVYDNMTSGLVGMSRAVDKYGINIRSANLQQVASNLGIQTAVSKMDQASKAMLRTIVILDSSRHAWANLAITINSPANQARILRQNLALLSQTIGSIFLPMVASVLPYLNGLVIAFQRLANHIIDIFGIKDKLKQWNFGTSTGNNVDALSEALDSIDDSGISDVDNATKDTNNNLKNATKNAKKLKQFLASYDELEIMNKNDSSLSDLANSKIKTPSLDTSALDAGILNDALDKLLNEYQKKWDAAYNSMENKAMAFANKVTDAFKKLAKAAEPTTKALKNLWNNGLKQLRNFTWTALKDFWKHFLKPLGTWTLGEKGLPRLINAFNDFLVKINWDKINVSLVQLWDVLEPFAENVGTGLLDFFDDFFDKAADGVNKLPDLIDKFKEFIKGISPEQAQDIGYKLGQLFSVLGGIKLLKGTIGILDKLGVGKFLAMLASHPLLALAGGLGAILLKLDSMGKIHIPWDTIGEGFSDLKDKITDYIDNIDWDAVQEGIQKFIDVITPIAEGILEGIGDTLKIIGKAFKKLFDALSTLTPDQLKSIGKGIEAIFAIKIATNLASTILNLGNAYSTLGTSLAGLKWLIKGGSALAKGLGAVLASGFGAAAVGAGLGLAATEKTVDGKGKERQFEEQSNDAKTASENLLGVLKDLDERGAITSQMFDTLSTKLNSFVAGTSTTTIFTSMRDAMIEAGISSDDLAVSIDNTGGNLEEFYNLVAHASDGAGNAGGQIKSFAEAINTVNPDPLVSKLYSLQTAEEQVTFADLIIQSSNAIDEMGGIWEDGKQILGDKAIAIYQAIQNGLEPDENGFYKIGEDQMVQFGNAIDDSGKTLKDKAQSTLSDPLKLAISEILPEYSTFGADAKGWFITGLTGTDAATDLKVQEAFKKVLEGIDTKYTEDIGKTTGKNMAGGITKGMEENSQTVKDATNKMVDDGIKTPAQDSLGIHSPSKWFEELAKFCGRGFREGLDTGFASALHWFTKLNVRISNSIGSLYNVGRNAIIGLNNGFVNTANNTLFKNIQNIANSISNTFRKVLKIHSPSQVMMELGGFTVEGFRLGMQNMLPQVRSTINDISAEVQKINTPTADIITKSASYQEVKSRMSVDTDDFVDDIRKEIMAISSNTFDNNQMIGQAVKNALNGMAIYADGHLIGYLKEENQQFRNRNGYGILEG
uniref:Minor tail protein n=1 Tax=Siphoviridae sp. ctv0N24 TaxID=2826509 RepID=A0A8S5N3U0_9CAUD|nr:MAG TPA: minor tail protein [Siphoviridae sp. ctv0N24]